MSELDPAEEIRRLNKIIQALMNRAERSAGIQDSSFNLFQTAVTLEEQVRRRTAELEAALRENERVNRALRESENHKRLLIDNAPVCIHEIDLSGRIISMNGTGLDMMGLKSECDVQGFLYLDAVCDADRAHIAQLLDQARAGRISHFEFKASGISGRIYKSCFVPIRDKNERIEKLMGITEDITERKLAEEKIRNFAFYDTLTQLANRRLFGDRLGQAIAVSRRSKHYGAVIFVDLDAFKPLNDMYGHDIGDLLLIEVAHRITRCVRESDTVARFGGDEFVVALGELGGDKASAMLECGVVAEKIREALFTPYELNRGQEQGGLLQYRCSASIGVTLFLNGDASQDAILKRADTAMYQAKESGRNKVCFF